MLFKSLFNMCLKKKSTTFLFLISSLLLSVNVYSGIHLQVSYFDRSIYQRVLIGHLFLELSGIGAMINFYPDPGAQFTARPHLPEGFLSFFSYVVNAPLPVITLSVTSCLRTKTSISCTVQQNWPYVKSTSMLAEYRSGSICEQEHYKCTQVNGHQSSCYREKDSGYINIWILIESLIRHAPDQRHARGYLNRKVKSPVFLQGSSQPALTVMEIQTTESKSAPSSLNCVRMSLGSGEEGVQFIVVIEFTDEPYDPDPELHMDQATRIKLIQFINQENGNVIYLRHQLLDLTQHMLPPPPPPLSNQTITDEEQSDNFPPQPPGAGAAVFF